MLRSTALALCVVLLAWTAAHALDCKSDNLNQNELDQCAGQAFDRADKELNARYQKIVACLKGEAKLLVEAQRIWVKFRDAECKFQGMPTEGGSIQPMVIENCLQAVTEQRNKDLDYYLTCQEGDLSCPTTNCDFHAKGPAK